MSAQPYPVRYVDPAALPAPFQGNALARAYETEFASVAGFYSAPGTREAMIERMRSLRFTPEQRDNLTALLLHGATRESQNPLQLQAIATLRDPKTFAVVAGQQAGLLGGPLFTIYKALHAVRLARSLSETTEFNVVPVFWIASEDHDLAEIDHIDSIGADNALRRLRLRLGPEGSAAEFALPEEDPARIVDELAAAFPDNDFKEGVLARLRVPLSMTAAAGFRLLMQSLFKNTSLIFADPFLLRPLGRDIIEGEIREPGRNAALIRAQGAALQAAGYETPVQLRGDCNLFIYEDNIRKRVDWSGGRFVVNKSDASYTQEELLAELRKDPLRFSTNVALRTLAQESAIPCAAAVVGAAELAYFGQFKTLFEAHGLRQPVLAPRLSATLLETKIARKLEKHRLSLADLGRLDALPDALAKSASDGPAAKAEALHADIQQQLTGLRDLMAQTNEALEKWGGKATSKIERDVSRLVERIREESDADRATLKEDLDLIATHLFPGGKPQERALNIVQYLLRYGWSLVDRLLETVDIDRKEHQVIELR